MNDPIGNLYSVQSWRGDERAWPKAPLEQGALRISGSVLDAGAAWYVTRDRLGWSTVVLVDDAAGRPLPDLRPTLLRAAAEGADPVATALAIDRSLGALAGTAGLGLARVDPHGGLVELLNVSLPTVLTWHPNEGMSPYEPLHASAAQLDGAASSDVIRLHDGGVVALASSGVLSASASWRELGGFVRSIGIDPLGGMFAEAPPNEVGRLLVSACNGRAAPRAMVVLGLPPAQRQVA